MDISPGGGAVVTADVWHRLVTHCGLAWPNEACGVLLGARRGDGVLRIERGEPLANRAPDPRRSYLIDAGELERLLAASREGGPGIVGVYHSHPAADSGPSRKDRLLAWPGWIYLNVSLREPRPGGREQAATFEAWCVPAGGFPPRVESALPVSLDIVPEREERRIGGI